MTTILGLSAFYHDSAAALVRDGVIVAAAQEERFTRVKHDASFPTRAVGFCLAEAGLEAQDLDLVAYYDKPLKTFDRLLETWLGYAPRGFAPFRRALPRWLEDRLFLGRTLRRSLPGYPGRLVYTDHHEAHAASAFFPAPFEEAAILTCDGVGEWATTTWGVGQGSRIRLERAIEFPHSLGLLYSSFTYFCGFRVNSGEYKLMGLAPYGEPRYATRIREHLIDVKPDGSYRLNMSYLTYGHTLRMTGARFAELFDGPPRTPESPITQREMDLAASVQAVVEEVVLAIGAHIHEQTGQRDLCMAGGVALNCVANGRLLREGPFERIWVQPAAGDAGGALGAALFAWHQLYGRERAPMAADAQRGSLLGPSFEEPAIRSLLEAEGAHHEAFEDEDELLEEVVDRLEAGRVVGWFQGKMEYGPRALGCRSILGDPRRPELQSVMNLKIKLRESFRPFAPSVLRERAHEWFDVPEGLDSPYMLLVAPVLEGRRREREGAGAIPAVTHVDGSARLQTVDAERHGRYHRLLQRFEARTGSPLLVNTSFNVRGEPIVCTPEDAFRCFLHTDMDALVMGLTLVDKSAQPEALRARAATPEARAEHLAAFPLD